jgi:hypothetical protein
LRHKAIPVGVNGLKFEKKLKIASNKGSYMIEKNKQQFLHSLLKSFVLRILSIRRTLVPPLILAQSKNVKKP